MMGVGRSEICVLLQLSLLLVSCLTVFGTPISLAPSPGPAHHHHHHRHPHYSQPPSLAPAPTHHHHHHGPVHAPMQPPTVSPTHPPPKPSMHPPVKPPVSPPLHPPSVKPPVHPPPVKPPVYPPAHPPHAPMERRFVAVQGVVYCKSCKYAGSNTLLGATPVQGAIVKLACNSTLKKPIVAKATTDKNGYFFIHAPRTVTTYAFHKCRASLLSSPVPKCSNITDLHGGLTGGMLRPEKPFISNKLPFVLYSVGPFAFAPKCY